MVFEQDNLPGDSLNVRDDMGGQNDDAVGGQGMDQVAEPHPLPGVQSGGGLIQQQQPGVREHGHGDAHPLAHTAGEGFQLLVRRVGQAHGVQQLRNTSLRLSLGQTLEGGGVAEELSGSIGGVEPKVLGQIAQQAPVLRPQGVNVLPVPQNLPLRGEE